MQLISCTYESHATAILEILNDVIVSSTAVYDYEPRAAQTMAGWFKAKEAGRFPVVGASDASGQLLGFATYGTFRAWPAYKYSVEHSVYVHRNHRGKGLGAALMRRLIATAMHQQYHVMVGGIDAGNEKSIALHENLGFALSGTIRHAGFKFGRWLDLAFYQLLLDAPERPVDG